MNLHLPHSIQRLGAHTTVARVIAGFFIAAAMISSLPAGAIRTTLTAMVFAAFGVASVALHKGRRWDPLLGVGLTALAAGFTTHAVGIAEAWTVVIATVGWALVAAAQTLGRSVIRRHGASA
jgi:hypothetical protein